MRQILTIQQLKQAAVEKRSVVVNHYIKSPSPAAWVINIIGSRLDTYLDAGMFIHDPKHRLTKFRDLKSSQPNQPKEIKLLENKL